MFSVKLFLALTPPFIEMEDIFLHLHHCSGKLLLWGVVTSVCSDRQQTVIKRLLYLDDINIPIGINKCQINISIVSVKAKV